MIDMWKEILGDGEKQEVKKDKEDEDFHVVEAEEDEEDFVFPF